MSWKSRFADKLISADDAAALIRDGDFIRLPMGPVPVSLVNAIFRRREALRGVRVLQGATRHPHPWDTATAEHLESIQFVSDFLTPLTRKGMDARVTDFAITDYAIGSRVLEEGRRDGWSSDAFLALVSEPDERGFVSFGYSLWHSKALHRAAKLTIAEVGRNVLRTHGDNFIHLSEFDKVVEQVDPPIIPPLPQLSQERIEVTEVIGAYVSTLVEDGDTLQIGTGTLSSTMGGYLMEKNDLGLDSEILVASAVEMIKAGVATGRRKKMRPDVATASFIVPGSDFDYCSDNPRIELHDIEWVNNLPRISTIPNLVAINQASMMDLTGQVASESIGPAMFTGPGGQLSWTVGAVYAPHGKAIHVLPSTARDGKVSRIVAELPPGTIVTVPRTFVDYVVTEHGIANLQGLTQRQRALALIELADPRYRDELTASARRLFWP